MLEKPTMKYEMSPEIRKIIKETGTYDNCYFDKGVFYNLGPTTYCCECGDKITQHDKENSFVGMCSSCRLSMTGN